MMDKQVERISIKRLLRQASMQNSGEKRQFSFLIAPGLAVNIEADACKVADIFAALPPGLQITAVKRILGELPRVGDYTAYHDDIFSDETVYVTRRTGEDERHIRLEVTH